MLSLSLLTKYVVAYASLPFIGPIFTNSARTFACWAGLTTGNLELFVKFDDILQNFYVVVLNCLTFDDLENPFRNFWCVIPPVV